MLREQAFASCCGPEHTHLLLAFFSSHVQLAVIFARQDKNHMSQSVLEKLQALKSDQEQKTKDSNKGGIPRSSSKQLAEARRSKSKENPIRESARRSKGKTPPAQATGWTLPGQKAAPAGAGQKSGAPGPASNTATLRLMQDLAAHEERFTPGVKLQVDSNDLLHPTMTVTPKEGYWAGAPFKFRMDFPKSYPIDAPVVTCLTKIYHPNIDFSGRVCLNVLRSDYSPVITLTQILIGMLHLFYEPNPDDPLNIPIAALMESNRAQFERNVKSSLQGQTVDGQAFPKLL